MKLKILVGMAGGLAFIASGSDAFAQSANHLAYVAERATARPVDSVMACLDAEIKRQRPTRTSFTVVKVTQSVTTGSGGTMRGPTETRNPPAQNLNSYDARVVRIDDRVVAQVTARTTQLEVSETQSRQRPVRVTPEARRVADRMLQKCAPPLDGDPGAEMAEDDSADS